MNTRMRSTLTRAVALAAAAGLALAACSSGGGGGNDSPSTGGNDQAASDQKVHTLTVASFLIDGTPNANMVNWFLDTLEEESEGRIQFERFPNESLCPGAEIVQCVSDGRADLGITVPTYTPDKFPLQNLSALPFMTDDNAAMMRAFYTLNQENEAFAAEADRLGLKALGYWPAGASLLGSKKPLASMADLEGVKIRAVGDGLLAAMDAAGAHPVALTAGEMYEGVERGVIDAIANNMDAPIDYKLMEVLPHWVDAGYGHYITIGMWISKAAYDALEPDLQELVDATTERLNTGEGIQKFAEIAATQCDVMLESDTVESFTRWDDAAIAEFKEATGDGAKQQWIETAEAAGVEDPASVLAHYEELLAEYTSDESHRVAPLAECAERFATER